MTHFKVPTDVTEITVKLTNTVVFR